MSSIPIQYKVDINTSYEWAEEASSLNISHRELEVFALVTEGCSNKEVAQILKIKHQSVKNHVHSFTKKLGVKNNTQALVIALYLKLIKVTGKYLNASAEIKADGIIDSLREVISGEAWMRGVDEKKKRLLRVFLKEHGIDPDNW